MPEAWDLCRNVKKGGGIERAVRKAAGDERVFTRGRESDLQIGQLRHHARTRRMVRDSELIGAVSLAQTAALGGPTRRFRPSPILFESVWDSKQGRTSLRSVSDPASSLVYTCTRRAVVRRNRYSTALSRCGCGSHIATLQLQRNAPAIQGRFSWAGIRGRGGRRRQDEPRVHI